MFVRTRGRRRRALAAAAVCALAAAAVYVGIASAGGPPSGDHGRGRGPHTYTIGLFGDMPYNALGRQQYPALLQNINDAHVSFSIFDGDLKAGGDGPCSDSLYTTSIAWFNELVQPLVWVPGDNDWTDCWGRYGPATQPYSDPIERLNHERQLFASTSQSLGQRTLTLTRQAGYPENVRWVYGPVVYLGLNVQGSNDNYPYHDTDAENPTAPVRSDAEIQRQRDEETARKAADLTWLDQGFAYAKRIGALGVLIDWQADPNFNNEQHLTNPHDYDAYQTYIDALRSETEAFDGQVALVHGDSHYFKVDKPINRSSGGGVLANFTRVETFGARNTHWVSATIDPRDPNLFEFEPQIVPANAN
jgi:hypothetical protein